MTKGKTISGSKEKQLQWTETHKYIKVSEFMMIPKSKISLIFEIRIETHSKNR